MIFGDMRLFKQKGSIDWKYVSVELFLIFAGINLAIWFNNWNTSRKYEKSKTAAIERIIEEIQSNQRELMLSREANLLVFEAYEILTPLYVGNSRTVAATALQMTEIQEKYPGFFIINDTLSSNGNLIFEGDTRINLELIDLSAIAWETTRFMGLTGRFDYECLYSLESLYRLQDRVQQEIDRSADALQAGDIRRLMRILNFLKQLDVQLERKYEETLMKIEECS
ncbi:MAG: hypothetical protein JXQ90_19270 [Cyclobacteriaceae bacterium]